MRKAAGAKMLLVGDPYQLSAVETGGAFGLLASRSDAPTLTVVRRFIDPDGTRRTWEERSAAGLRAGDESALAAYREHDRIAGGERDDMTDSAYSAWLADTRAGLSSLLIAADNASVRALNERARADMIAAGTVDQSSVVTLHDGSAVGAGDRIVTRTIDRHLSDGSATRGRHDGRTDGFVRNGQQWSVERRARRDGSLVVRLLDARGRPSAAAVTLPPGTRPPARRVGLRDHRTPRAGSHHPDRARCQQCVDDPRDVLRRDDSRTRQQSRIPRPGCTDGSRGGYPPASQRRLRRRDADSSRGRTLDPRQHRHGTVGA